MKQYTELDAIYGRQYSSVHRMEAHRQAVSGVHHWRERLPLRPAPDQPVTLFARTSGPRPFDRVVCRFRVGRLPWQEIDMACGAVEFDALLWDYVRIWEVVLPALPRGEILWYQIAGQAAGGSAWVFAENQAALPEDGTLYALSCDRITPPDWSRQAAIYHIFVDRFNPGGRGGWRPARDVRDFFGGTLRGVEEKLPHIQALGFDAIWLSPIFASPSHHGYDTTDLFSIEPRLGTEADFDHLLASAHSRGMRLLLDFVPNHWSDQHPTFAKALESPDSPFIEWYRWRRWPDDYESYYQVRSMPKLNLSPGSPARRHLLEAARYWLQRGVDGYRLDHVEGPVSNFWVELRQACLQANPNCWLFGEIVRPPAVMRTYAYDLHGSLDFGMAGALRETFALNNWDLARFDAFLRAHSDYFPEDFSLPAFLDNHDMNRFLFVAGGDPGRLRAAALVLYSLQSPIVLYYGTEAGLSQHNSVIDGLGLDEARLPFPWESWQEAGLADYFARLAQLRKTHSISGGAHRRTLALAPADGLYVYLWETAEPLFMVALNTGREERTIRLEDPFALPAADLLSGTHLKQEAGRLEIRLPAGACAWISTGTQDG